MKNHVPNSSTSPSKLNLFLGRLISWFIFKKQGAPDYNGRTPGYVSIFMAILFIGFVYGIPYLMGKDLPRWSYFAE